MESKIIAALVIGVIIGLAIGYIAAPKGVSIEEYDKVVEEKNNLTKQVSQLQQQVSQLQQQLETVKAKVYTVNIAYKEGIGYYLTDSEGKTLYYFAKDVSGKSACYGDCAYKWPPFYAEKLVLPPGLKKEDFSVITRTDGSKQLAYKGWPLYYFFKDEEKGQINGEGVKQVWYVMKPDYTVMIAYNEEVGLYLVDDEGMTLYYFAKDQPNVSNCMGECRQKWPPFYVEQVVAPSPIKNEFGEIQVNGGKQTTFKQYPLYYFFIDQKRGDIKGQGVKDVWFVVNPFNFP